MGLLGSFLNPWLLAGLALASAPIIIHLFNRRRFKVQEWAAMDFLVNAASTNRRRLKLEDFILLLLRTLLIIFLVLAVSRPVVRGLGDWHEDRRVIVLDDSFSMQLSSTIGSVFDLAKENARRQIHDAIGGSIPVALYSGVNARPITFQRPDTLSISGSSDVESNTMLQSGWNLLQSMKNLEAGDLRLRLGRVLESVVEESVAEDLQRQSIVIISDFRRVDWLGEKNDLENELDIALQRLRENGLERRLAFQLIDVGRENAENIALTDLKISSPHALVGAPVHLEVEVTNFSKTTRPLVEGSLEILSANSGKILALNRIPLPPFTELEPGEPRTIEVEYTFENEGTYLLRANVGTDALPGDNERHAVLQVRRGLKVMALDGDPGDGRFNSESGFWKSALSPRGRRHYGVLPEVRTEPLDVKALEDVDAVFVLNRKRLSNDEQAVLHKFAREGGGVAFFLGNQIDAKSYTRLARGDEPLFPVELGGQKKGKPRVSLAIASPDHPTLEVYRGIDGMSFERPLFSRYFEANAIEGSHVLAHYTDKDQTAALIERPLGEGHVVVFNTSADRDWSDWPTDPSYSVLLQEWTRHISPRHGSEYNVDCGSEISWEHTPGKSYTVVTPMGKRIPLTSPADPADTRMRFSRTSQAGFYLVETHQAGDKTRESGAGIKVFACRRSPLESDLKVLHENELSRLLESRNLRFTIGQDIEIEDFKREQEGELWRWLALVVGSLLLVELFAAYVFGKQ